MKKTAVFTIADIRNMPYALMMQRSFNYFHPDIPVIIYDDKKIAETGVPREIFFYLATPYIARELFKEYECVIKIDSDSIVTGNLNHILDDELFDVAVVQNWNRIDPAMYGQISLATISPQEYHNNGFVVMRNKDFATEWMQLCNSVHFQRMPFREQGFLNIMAHYGRFNVRRLDYSNYWHGLISKGEWNRCIIKDNEMILPKGEDNYPDQDKTIKVIHWAGGNADVKMNYKIYFSEECIKFLDTITHEKKT